MAKEPVDFTLPSDPTQRKQIKDAVYEAAGVMLEIKDKRSYISDTKKDMKEKFKIPPKLFSQMVKTHMAANFQDVVAENEAFSAVFEILFESGTNATSAASTYSADDAE